jgi:hypothetical protein
VGKPLDGQLFLVETGFVSVCIIPIFVHINLWNINGHNDYLWLTEKGITLKDSSAVGCYDAIEAHKRYSPVDCFKP